MKALVFGLNSLAFGFNVDFLKAVVILSAVASCGAWVTGGVFVEVCCCCCDWGGLVDRNDNGPGGGLLVTTVSSGTV